jgi:hypothetical protein
MPPTDENPIDLGMVWTDVDEKMDKEAPISASVSIVV